MTHHVFHVAGGRQEGPAARAGLRYRTANPVPAQKHQARKLARQLTEAVSRRWTCGNLSQPARDRNLAAFTAGTARVLVATDIAACGVHVDDVELVVHCDPPAEHKAYLHRSGRTARAGRARCRTVVLPEQRRDTQVLLRKAGITATPQPVTADSAWCWIWSGSWRRIRPAPGDSAPTARRTGAREPQRRRNSGPRHRDRLSLARHTGAGLPGRRGDGPLTGGRCGPGHPNGGDYSAGRPARTAAHGTFGPAARMTRSAA